MLGVIKRSKEPRFVKVEALQNLFGRPVFIVVTNVSQLMKSRRSNYFVRTLFGSLKRLIINCNHLLSLQIFSKVISVIILFSTQAVGQGIEVEGGILIECCSSFPKGRTKDGAAISGGSRVATYNEGRIQKFQFGERDWSVICSADLPLQFVSFAKKYKRIHFHSGSIPMSQLPTDTLRCVGRLTIPNVVQFNEIDYATHEKDPWNPSHVQRNGIYYEKVVNSVSYLLIEAQKGDYFVTPEQEADWILEATEKAVQWGKCLPDELIFKEEAIVEERIHLFRITKRGFIFADSDSSSKADFANSKQWSDWNVGLVKADISCNYNSQTKRFEFPVRVIDDYYFYILKDRIHIDSMLVILHPEAFEWQADLRSARLNPKFNLSDEELTIEYWRDRVESRLSEFMVDSVNINGVRAQWSMSVDDEFPQWPVVEVVKPSEVFSQLTPYVEERLKGLLILNPNEYQKDYNRQRVEEEWSKIVYTPFRVSVSSYFAYKALKEVLYLKSVQDKAANDRNQAEANAETIRKLRVKHGSKFVDAALEGDIQMGMPEELLPIPLQFWSISSRDDWAGGYALWCKFRMNTAKKLKVVVNNGKVSRVSTW